jgi:cell volume regulation protein A
VGRLIRDLALPSNAVVALIARGAEIVPPRGTTRIQAGDHIFVVLRQESRSAVDRVFRRADERPTLPPPDFELRASATLADLEEFYGIRLPGDDGQTIDEVLRHELGDAVRPGATLNLSGIAIMVREMIDERIDTVGLHVTARDLPDDPPAAATGTGGQRDGQDDDDIS